MNEASPTLAVLPEKIKHGAIRKDGFRFRAYVKRLTSSGVVSIYESWLSPPAWENYNASRKERSLRKRKRKPKDPRKVCAKFNDRPQETKFRAGDARSDGFRFAGYMKKHTPNGILFSEHWLSPKAYFRRILARKRRHVLHKKKREAWRRANAQKQKELHIKWVANNRDKVRAAARKYAATVIKACPSKMLASAIRRNVHSALRGRCKLGKTERLLGCAISQLRLHLESQFKDGMTWQNYGPVWHVDHIVPVSWFDLTTEAGQLAAFHYTNVQPLWASENIRKNNRYSG
jgi:hypothetical protein